VTKRIAWENFASAAMGGGGSSKEPWYDYNTDEVYFKPYKIQGERWTGTYDYRLLVVDAGSNQVISTSGKAGFGTTDFNFYNEGGESFVVEGNLTRWEYILPISPQNLNISDTYAIANTPTLRGINEEHNGVKYKQISVRATTGIWKDRPSLDEGNKSSSGLEGFLRSTFGNTISAAEDIADGFNSFLSVLGGGHPKASSAVSYVMTAEAEKTTGYYKALQLQQFIEQYAIAKNDPANRDWRLVFDMPKLNQTYVVTPQNFVLSKSSDKPNEHMINFNFKAWKRIDLNGWGVGDDNYIPPLDEPGWLQRALGTIRSARAVLGDAKNLITAVRGDLVAPFEVLRQASLFVKDLAGVATSTGDLIEDVFKGDLFEDAWKDALASLTTAGLINREEFSDGENAAIDAAVSLKVVNENQPFKAGQGTSQSTKATTGGLTDADLNPALSSLKQDKDKFFSLLNK